MKKICLVAHEAGYYKGQGGIASYVELTAKGFKELGCEVSVIYFEGSDIEGVRNYKIENVHSAIKNSILVDKILEKMKPDVVECTDFQGLIHQTLLKRSLKGLDYECKFIVNHHTGIREIWEWGTEVNFYNHRSQWFAQVYNAERTQALLADANFSTSEFLSLYLQKKYEGSYNYCPSYYPVDSIKKVEDGANDYNKFKILSLGRFELRKKQEILIKACCKLIENGMDIEVTLIGNSTPNFITSQDYMQYCYEVIPLQYKSKFKFFDFISYKELRGKYQEYDMFIVPSPYENFPNTALESIKYGLLTSGSLSSGIKDMVGETCHDVCFEPNSVESMALVIEQLYKLERKQRNIIATKQFDHLKLLTSFQRTIEGRLNQYDEVTSSYGSHKNNSSLVVYLEKGVVKTTYFKNTEQGSDWQSIQKHLCEIDSIIIRNTSDEYDEYLNYVYPDAKSDKVIIAHVPDVVEQIPMTVKDFLNGKVAFYDAYIPFSLEDVECDCIYSMLASTLHRCDDIIEVRVNKKSTTGLGRLIKYYLDKQNEKKL